MQKKYSKNYKRKKIQNFLSHTHTGFTLLHTEHAALVLIHYSTIPIIVEKLIDTDELIFGERLAILYCFLIGEWGCFILFSGPKFENRIKWEWVVNWETFQFISTR